MEELDPDELAEKDGREGRPVYIAYGGKVYDVSRSKLWKTGTHMKRHQSGKDLTVDIGGAPHWTRGPRTFSPGWHPEAGSTGGKFPGEFSRTAFRALSLPP